MATPAYGAQAGTVAEPNNAALYDARRRQQVPGSQIVDNIVSFSNCAWIRSRFQFRQKELGAIRGRADDETQLTETKWIDCGKDS